MEPRSLPPYLLLALAAPAVHAQAPLFDIRGASGDQLATSIAALGDVDGDGFGDVALGAPRGPGAEPDAGYVSIRSGRTGAVIATVQGERAGDLFGWAVAGLGDVDGDGAGDLIIGAPGHEWTTGTNRGAVYVRSGATGAAIWKLGGNQDHDQCGFAVAGPGDVDGDGVPDYAFSMPFSDAAISNGGIVWIHSGAAHTVLRLYLGQTQNEHFGWSLDAAGDMDGDGVPDLVAGAPGFAAAGIPAGGRVQVLGGHLSQSVLFSLMGLEPGEDFGWSVAGGEDMNGDGIPDVAVGAPYSSLGGNDAGRARVYSGASGHAVLMDLSGGPTERMGHSLDLLADVDGDGRADLAVGSPGADVGSIFDAGRVTVRSGAGGAELFYMTGYEPADRMGQAVASAGDINGDGATDVVGGASFADGHTIDGGWGRFVLGNAAPPTRTCTAKVNSLGCTPWITYAGCASVTVGDNLLLVANDVIAGLPGMLIWSRFTASLPFYGGTLCVGPPIQRMSVQVATSAGFGTCTDGQFVQPFTQALMATYGLVPGDVIHTQFWSRDTGFAPPNNVGLTDSLAVPILP